MEALIPLIPRNTPHASLLSEEPKVRKRDRWRVLAEACLPRGLAACEVRRKWRRGSLGALGFPSS